MTDTSRYSEFVEHPRYGRGPRLTTLVVKGTVYLGWRTKYLIPNTAVKADISKQKPATFHFTHYYDQQRRCLDCDREFIFFALEQKYWYEELGFGFDSDCVRCVPCRQKQQGHEWNRRQYEDLFHTEQRSSDQTLTMAECMLELIENKIFTPKQTQRIRMLLNQLPEEFQAERVRAVRRRLKAIEQDCDAGE